MSSLVHNLLVSYQVGPHILYSRNATELSQFLSELLDMDIRPGESGVIWLANDQMRLQVIQASHDSLLPRTTERDTILCFSMNDLQSLEDLLYKVQFLSYRHGDNIVNDSEKKATLHQQGGEYFFFLKDLDGRRWKFSFQS